MAGHIIRGGGDPDGLRALLQVHNRRWCRPPLPAHEIDAIVRSAATWRPAPMWTVDPMGFAADPRLSRDARAVLRCIADHANVNGRAWPSYRRIAAITGVGKNRIGRCVTELEAVGRIKVLRRSGGFCCTLLDYAPSSTERGVQAEHPLVVLSPPSGQGDSSTLGAPA